MVTKCFRILNCELNHLKSVKKSLSFGVDFKARRHFFYSQRHFEWEKLSFFEKKGASELCHRSHLTTQEFIANGNHLIVTAFVEDLRENFPQICLGHPLKFPTIGQQTTISQNLQQSFGLHQSTISRFFNASKDGDTSGLTNSSRDNNKKELPPGKIQNVKVHTKKKCLHDLQLTQFGGTFTKPFTNFHKPFI